MKQIGVTCYTIPEKRGDPTLQFQVVNDNGGSESGLIMQSRVFDLRDDQTLQIRPYLPPVTKGND